MHDLIDRPSSLRTTLLVLLAAILFCGSHVTWAQANSSASKTAAISAFGGYTYSNPDYGTQKNHGVTFGADYTRYFGWRLVPSFEVRGNYNTGLNMTQEAIFGGLKVQMDFRRFHPYADVLGGGTKIIFKFPPSPVYTQDQAFALSLGGGVDIDIARNFQAKIDFQSQNENFGPNGTQPNNADFTLTPSLWTVGVAYRIPFRMIKSKR